MRNTLGTTGGEMSEQPVPELAATPRRPTPWYRRFAVLFFAAILVLLTLLACIPQYSVVTAFVRAVANDDLTAAMSQTSMLDNRDTRAVVTDSLHYRDLTPGGRVGVPFPLSLAPTISRWTVPVFGDDDVLKWSNTIDVRLTWRGFKVVNFAGG
jgi:hypothetical protein